MILTRRICFILLCGINSVYTESTETDVAHEKTEKSASSEKEDAIQPIQVEWPQGVVPYYVDPHTYDDIIATRIRMAMNTIESLSCVLFKAIPLKPPPFAGFMWLHITNPDSERDCRHTPFVGTKGNALLVLGYECMQRRDIIHSLLHVLGFNDEVTHPQRDMYIRVLWQNIQPRHRPLFRINSDEPPYKMMVEYDSMSIMHFHDRAFSSNGGATLAPLIPGLLINPSDKLSQLDIMKLRLAFGHECNRRKVGNLLKTCENALRDNSVENSSEGNKGHIQYIGHNSEHSESPEYTDQTSVSEESESSEGVMKLAFKKPRSKKKHRGKSKHKGRHHSRGPTPGHNISSSIPTLMPELH